MSRYADLFSWFRTCPLLKDLWSIAAVENNGVKVIIPQGASPIGNYQDYIDNCGNYICEFVPYASVYEDYQINCYEWYDVKDSSPPTINENVLSLEEVQGVIDWVNEQNKLRNFPSIGETVIAVECMPFVPQIRYTNPAENTIGYFITIRIRYINPAERKELSVWM